MHILAAPYTTPLTRCCTPSLFIVLSLSGFAVIATTVASEQRSHPLLFFF